MSAQSMEERMAVAERDIEALQGGEAKVWETMDRIKEAVANIRVQNAATIAVVGLLQTVVLGFLMWKLTKG